MAGLKLSVLVDLETPVSAGAVNIVQQVKELIIVIFLVKKTVVMAQGEGEDTRQWCSLTW